eukprot:TRINITY_DN3506_c0_g1_i2.p4 TRINITY_DN3506_c0_g1~~TRINITY_DN3506_c0_g1_i2.p4  ORF type:complete len:100 (+),score=3.97 TRINITY_DN3506_c0_g1_i2:238-537(+)
MFCWLEWMKASDAEISRGQNLLCMSDNTWQRERFSERLSHGAEPFGWLRIIERGPLNQDINHNTTQVSSKEWSWADVSRGLQRLRSKLFLRSQRINCSA